ncbi:cyclic nucleotide-gated ion channel 1 [Citrus sinensis]|uniref:Cyclic nucleotide-gated ion channel 1 n=1 Tax=Citrus sinensis TaxID=2711 RepID=A0ACB8HRB2_CITSI|nr:cyclic nucleotide-gated ion channel 1 [Citrus sinensis]
MATARKELAPSQLNFCPFLLAIYVFATVLKAHKPTSTINFTSRFFDLEGGAARESSGEINYGSSSAGRVLKPRVRRRLALEIERIRTNRQVSKAPKSRYGIVGKSMLYLKIVLSPHGPLWNWIFLISCLIAISLDPLFLYIPVISDEKKCLRLDNKLGTAAIFLRSFLDFFHIIYVIFRLRTKSFAPCWEYPQRSLNEYAQEITRKYLLFFLPIDLLAILPLPQVVVSVIIQTTRGSKVLSGLKLLKFFVIFQYVPSHASFYCHDTAGNNTFVKDFCPTKPQNTSIFDFGIFQDALQSGIVEVTDFPQKFSHCFLWGLQNLSCFGQNLQTSSYFWENFFAIVITISGLVFFLYLIGNIQIYLQSKTIRSEEMRLKGQEIEQWMGFRKLSRDLQQKLRNYRQYVWRETKGVDVENLLNNLPSDLKRNIKSELGLELLLNVPLFQNLDAKTLDDICSYLKPVLYAEESHIVLEGDRIDGMLFVMRGKLWSATMVGGRMSFQSGFYLSAGDYYGEELISWALDPNSSHYLPISSRTVRAATEVEAFVLMSDNLRAVTSELSRRLCYKQLHHAFRVYSHQWRTWAACSIQAAWRRYKRRNLEEFLNAEENRLQGEWAAGGGITSSLGATIYPSRFAAHALLAAQSNRSLLLQKPAEPDFRLAFRKMLMTDFKMPLFQSLDAKTLDDICIYLKPVLYEKKSWIFREGRPVDKTLFIMQGKLDSMTSNNINGGTLGGFFNLAHLGTGDLCGEELLTWALDPQSSFRPPNSTRTVVARTEVEAFALTTDDLKAVASKSRRLRSKLLRHTYRFYSQQWRTWAACSIQAAWSQYKLQKLQREKENRVQLQDTLAKAGGSSPSSEATLFVSRLFATDAPRSGARKTRLLEKVPAVPNLKPVEPSTAEEQ